LLDELEIVLVILKPTFEMRPNGGLGLGPVKQVRATTSVPVQSATALASTTAVIRLKCFISSTH
jgi:hypothetical protein